MNKYIKMVYRKLIILLVIYFAFVLKGYTLNSQNDTLLNHCLALFSPPNFMFKKEQTIYLLGEVHGSEPNPYLLYALAKQSKRSNVNFLIEFPPSVAFLYNQYLNETINLSNLDSFFSTNRFLGRHSYLFPLLANKLQTEGVQVRFFGVDKQTNGSKLWGADMLFAIAYFKQKFDKASQLSNIVIALDNLETTRDVTKFIKQYHQLRRTIPTQKDAIITLLSTDDYNDFIQIFSQEDINGIKDRDEAMFNNFIRAQQLFPISEQAITIGTFGACHIISKGSPFRNLTIRLKNQQINVLTIGIQLLQSEISLGDKYLTINNEGAFGYCSNNAKKTENKILYYIEGLKWEQDKYMMWGDEQIKSYSNGIYDKILLIRNAKPLRSKLY